MPLPNNPEAKTSENSDAKKSQPLPPPVAQDDALTSVAEDSGLRLIPIASLLSNDSKGPLTITAVSNPVGGTVAIKGTKIEFTPTADFNGTASFDYTVSKNGKTDTGTVSFVVTAVNDAPVATDDVLTSVAEDSGKRIISFDSLLGNDSAGPANESAQTLTITAVGNAVGGTVAINGSNVEFTPDADFNGPASFDYILSDGGLIDTGSVSFAITEVNDAPQLNIIRDDPTTDTILYGTAGSDIFVFDASATYSSTQSIYGSTIIDSIVGFDPTQDQIALVNFDTRYLSSSPPVVEFGISLDNAPGDYATYDSYLTLSRPGLHHEIHAIDMTPFPVDDVHIYANDPYAGLSSVPVPPPPPPEPNIIRDDPSAYNVLHATAGADVFVFEADKYTGVTTSDYIIGFDPAHDQIALVNIPSWDNFWFGNSLVLDPRDGENAPGLSDGSGYDGYMEFQTQGGWTHTVWTIDSMTFDPGALHLYHDDPFLLV